MANDDQPDAAALAIATARLPGIDVARALAVLGMVLVNYKLKMGAATEGPVWLVWLSSLIDGRAAALFVVLAGIGISLRSRRARKDRDLRAFERSALLKRAAVLFVAGLVNLHMWEWDILHFYGAYLAIAAFLLPARGWLLWGLAIGFLWVDAVVLPYFDFTTEAGLWSGYGLIVDLFFEGLHPVFPWMIFMLIGMWLGQCDLGNIRICRRILIGSVTGAVGFFLWEVVGSLLTEPLPSGESRAMWVTLFMLPSETTTILTDLGIALSVICICIPLIQKRAERRWVAALVATGQLAFTLYIGHAIAILIPQQHELLMQSSLLTSIGYSLAFYLSAMMFCVWWRRRWPYGPLEGLIRQVTGRTTPAPWGGERLA